MKPKELNSWVRCAFGNVNTKDGKTSWLHNQVCKKSQPDLIVCLHLEQSV